MSTLSGLQELDARIDALNWIARTIDLPADVAGRITATAQVFAEARSMVARDYDAPPAEAEPLPDRVTHEPPPDTVMGIITTEARTLAQLVIDDAEAEGEPVTNVIVASAAVIREWAQKQGIQCPQVGRLSQQLLDEINERRALKRLTPFELKRGEGA